MLSELMLWVIWSARHWWWHHLRPPALGTGTSARGHFILQQCSSLTPTLLRCPFIEPRTPPTPTNGSYGQNKRILHRKEAFLFAFYKD
eukprot:4595680-Amphidinium_carterae.1